MKPLIFFTGLFFLYMGVLFFTGLFYLSGGLYAKQVPQKQMGKVLATETQKEPMRLKIPKINVDAVIENVGITSNGAMETPYNTANVGWFNLGPRPGDTGSAVIAGHFDKEDGGAGVFANLYKLKAGDKLYVEDSKGTVLAFVVRESRNYDPGYAEEVFTQSQSAHLNLITCYGVWDEARKSYSKRLVVFADLTAI